MQIFVLTYTVLPYTLNLSNCIEPCPYHSRVYSGIFYLSLSTTSGLWENETESMKSQFRRWRTLLDSCSESRIKDTHWSSSLFIHNWLSDITARPE